MKKLTFAALAVVLTFSSLSLLAQTNDDMKAMMAAATPGDEHKMLAKSVGVWKGDIKMWMQPGAAPTASTGETTNEMIMGGRYLQSKNTGNFMNMPFEGIGVTGYDNVKKVFVNSWIDNMGTGIMSMTGTWDPQSKSINFTGTMADPMSGKDVAIRQVLKMVDDNTQLLEMYSTANGQEVKNMEIKYTRK